MSNAEAADPTKFQDSKLGKRHRILESIWGSVNILLGIGLVAIVVYLLAVIGNSFYEDAYLNLPIRSIVIFVINIILVGIVAVLAVIVGFRLILGKVRLAHLLSETIVTLLIACALCSLMLNGITADFWVYVVAAAVGAVIFDIADPALAEERKLQRRLRKLGDKELAEEGKLGLDTSGRGLIAINFFNLFWIFTIGMFIGDVVETVYHYMVVVPGEFQIRAGLLWGPFSPIYGIGAVLLTLILNRFYKMNFVVIFLVSAVVGGAFEYFASWFLEYAFGSVAWDYSGRFLNIGGRTDFMFMCMWGFLGVCWIKAILPVVVKTINKIPWQWRYAITGVCAALLAFDCAMTLMALDCWYLRLAGAPTDEAAYTQFFAQYFNNDYMSARFESMTIHPELTSRV